MFDYDVRNSFFLRVMGTSVNLKNKFAGYKVELIVQHNNILQIVDLVREKLPGTYA